MSARIVNVRPKPGFLMDGAGGIVPARSNVVAFNQDRLTNAMSGMGTTVDRRSAAFYSFVPLTGPEAEAGYRSSWLVRKIVDVPPFDMTREWRDWQAEGADIGKLEAEERRLQLKAKCQRALVLARLYGGAGLILGTADADPLQPLRPDSVKAGGLAYVHVMSRWQLTEGPARLDPADPWFGQPQFFTINSTNGQQIKLHPSRVVAFIGQKTPEGGFYTDASWFWGDPIMQSIGDAVRNADLAQSGFASLIDRAAVDVVKLKDLMSQVGTTEGEERIKARLAAAQMGKSNYRALILDMEDEWQQMQLTWAGIPDVMMAFLNVVAGAADIPVTRLLGQSPKGLQSTGDGEERDYHAMVKARQHEMLSPALDRIDDLLIRSALGSRPDDVYYEFGALDDVSEKDAATIEFNYAQALKLRTDTGAMPDQALAKIEKNRMIESGRYPGSQTAFTEADAAGADPAQNEGDLTTLEQRVAAMEGRGTVTADQALALIRDAAPRSLYVSRKLLNADAVNKWAKSQGFTTTVPADEMHVTVLYSREPVDWMQMGSPWDQENDGKLRVAPGGPRMLDRFGSMKDAVVLLFNSSPLSWRHEDMISKGASSDYDTYAPHVTITYDAPADLDLSKVEPYQGEMVFGPEVFAEIVDDWKQSIEEE
jgi:phage-related protein (TIGR01555 family)